MDKNFSPLFTYEKAIPYGTAAVAALAIIFDVGYFSAADIYYFNFFGIQEHILFSIAAAPFAILFILFFIVLYVANRAAFKTLLRIALHNEWAESFKRKYRILYCLSLIGSGLGVWIYVNSVFRPSELWSALTVSAIFAVWCVVTFESFITDLVSRLYFVLTAALLGLFVFAIGYSVCGRFINNDNMYHFIQLKSGGPKVAGRLVRSGERGILYYDTNEKKLNFAKWDDVDSISGNARFGSFFYSYFY